MPARIEIEKEIIEGRAKFQDTVRQRYLKDLNEHTQRDTIILASGFTSKGFPNIPVQYLLITLEDIQGFMSALHGLKGNELDLIIHSPGGSADAADQIVQYLRAKYKHIRAIIPHSALSAATMIACACDEIILAKHSAIGPIDPQLTVMTAHGALFSTAAQALLDEFEQAKREIASSPASIPIWLEKIRSYPPGLLTTCQNAIDLSKMKVEEWLTDFMFEGERDGPKKAKDIAGWLGNSQEHKTHGRPIMYKAAQDKGLKITLLESDADLQEKVLSVYHAISTTFSVTNCTKLIENHNGQGSYWGWSQPQ